MNRTRASSVDLVFERRHPDKVAALLTEAGFEVRTRAVREPEPDELTPHAVVVARKHATG